MYTTRRAANPFAMMLDPEAVLKQIEHSERLERLQRRICRPLDKPLIGKAQGDVAAHNLAVDAADDDAE